VSKRDCYLVDNQINPIREPDRFLHKKPVILFYNYKPEQKIDIKIKLDNAWKFDYVYPLPKRFESNNSRILNWEIVFLRNSLLKDPINNKYAYLFWEANITDKTYLNSKLLDSFYCYESMILEMKLLR